VILTCPLFVLLSADRPPAEIPSPTPAPPPTSSISVTLDSYAIDYILSDSTSMPIRDDFLALEEVTAEYFEEYMMGVYSASTQAKLISFDTVLVTSILT
jgi:hypothetical protein